MLTVGPGRDRFRWMEAVSRDKALSAVQKVVLIRLAMYRNEKTGRLDPSVIGLASETSLSERGIQKILGAVEAGGWIRRNISRGGSGRRNSYELTWPPQEAATTPHSSTPFLDREMSNAADIDPEQTLSKPRTGVRTNKQHTTNRREHIRRRGSLPQHRAAEPAAMPDQGRYEWEIANRLGADGYVLLMRLPEPEVATLCRQQRSGKLTDQMLHELRFRAG